MMPKKAMALDNIVNDAVCGMYDIMNRGLLRDVKLPRKKAGRYIDELRSFHERRQKEYSRAKFKDAQEKAKNDTILYAMKYMDAQKLKAYLKSLSDCPRASRQRAKDTFDRKTSRIEIELTDGLGKQSWKAYNLIPVRKEYRSFFPGYRKPFVLETDAGDIVTHLTSSSRGTRKGAKQGEYIDKGLKPWYDLHLELKSGDRLIITKKGKDRYTLGIKPKQD